MNISRKKNFDRRYKKGTDLWSTGPIPNLLHEFIELLKDLGVKKVLDLGCGNGRISLMLAKNGFEVFGVDFSKEAIRKARESIKSEKSLTISFDVGDILEYNFGKNEYGAILDIGTIHTIPKKYWSKYILNVQNTLKPGGLMYLREFSINTEEHFGFTPTKEKNWISLSGRYSHFFSMNEILDLFKDFEVVKCKEEEGKKMKTAPVHHSYYNCILRSQDL